MENNNLDVNKIYSSSFSNFTNQIVPIIANTLIVIVASCILTITVIGILLVPAIKGGYLQSMIDASRGKKINIGDFFSSKISKWWTLLVAGVLYWLGVFVGFICLILPGIYLMIRWSFISHLIVDKDKNISDAFSGSAEMVSNQFWNVCVIFIINTIIWGIASVFPFALLISVPFNSLVLAYYYNQLFSNSNQIEHLGLTTDEK